MDGSNRFDSKIPPQTSIPLTFSRVSTKSLKTSTETIPLLLKMGLSIVLMKRLTTCYASKVGNFVAVLLLIYTLSKTMQQNMVWEIL